MELVIKPFEQLTVRELYDILTLRVNVFVVEQNCPYAELDGKDPFALHLYLRDQEGIQAYLRVMDRGVAGEYVTIGRVVTARRGLGLGDQILRAGIQAARERFHADCIYLEAQTYAKGFYARQGFRQISEEFMMDGIPHVEMLLTAENP
ncbi:MAG: GNAT family N-acetyltransferase [Clostridia bacterium]|nr:GNAT family N-acetyltransferase [Clostridia bacterium]